MKKSKALSILLTLTLLGSIAIPGTLAGQANAAEDQDNGMVIKKTASTNGDGTYTIQLEAYATGDKVITEVTEEVPTDIVLVLDQSGSMDEPMSSYAFQAYAKRDNSDFYNLRHNGAGKPNLYYPLNDGSYATVSVTVEEGGLTYTEITNGRNNQSQGWNEQYTNYWSNRNILYALVNGEYQKVTLTQETEGSGWDKTTYFVYKLPGGKTIARSKGWNGTPTFEDIDGGVLYLASADENQNVYTYTYTDADGTTQTIGTSTGANTEPDFTLYQRYEDNSTSRLEALKSAVTNFANSVNEKAAGADGQLGTTDDVNHRVAVVGFASKDGYGNNTELLSISGSNSGSVGVEYDSIQNQHLTQVLQNMDTQSGQNMVQSAINALNAEGATEVNLGMDMANRILNANPIPDGEKRTRVVILFTDGAPTSWTEFDTSVANSAISTAGTIKDGGAKVYSVGVFEGADATSAGNLYGTSTEKCNWFMQMVSSNNGSPQNPSYYLSAADSATLNNIFQQISDQIESGGSSTTLSEETVIRDIIAPAFTLPENSDASAITLETYSCTGKEGGEYTWEKNNTAMGAEVVIDSTDASDAVTTNNQVSVTGFDFAENYVGTVTDSGGTTYRGNKLVITFKVEPREGFFGGNGVCTNTSAGVYENSSADEPVMTFERPTVDVPLAEPVVDVPDANVYLGAYYKQSVPEDAVKMGATVIIGGYEIDFSKPNYGLEPWQNEYVNISIEAAAEGNGGSFENLTEDITYTVTVTVAPTTEGSAGAQTAADTGTIHVFKPQLTYQDSQAWYGDTVPEVGAANLTEETWIHHGDDKKHDDPDVQMLNDEPELSMTYTPDSSKITDGKVNTKQDIGVHVDVAMNDENIAKHTTFIHENCAGKTCTLPDGAEFLLHVNTCRLTIRKTGGAADEPYVFTVYKDGAAYTELTIVGNNNVTIYELPVGNYTIQEDTGWSWRYNADNGGAAGLTAEIPEGEITCTNRQNNKIYWLNGFSEVVENIFGNQH